MRLRDTILLTLLILPSSVSVSLPASPQRPVPSRGAPAYMQHLKALEESTYVVKAVMKNGLTVIVNEFRALPVVDVLVFSKSGYLSEPKDLAGVTKVIEHLFYQPGSRKPGEVEREVQGLGGKLETSSGPDSASFRIVVPSAQWKKALDLQASALQNPAVSQEELAKAVARVRAENSMLEADPDETGRRSMLEAAFPGSPQLRSPYGTDESLADLTPGKVLERLRSLVAPEQLIVVVAGDVTVSDVLQEAVRLMAKLRGAPSRGEAASPETSQRTFRFEARRGEIPRPKIMMGFHAASIRSQDYPALEVLDALLGLGEGSVLSRRLRYEKRVLDRIRTSLESSSRLGYWIFDFETDVGNFDRGEISVLTEFEALKRVEPARPDLERALAQLERRYWESLQTVSQRAETLARYEARGSWKGMNEHLARLRRVRPADVKRVAVKYLRLENCTLLEYLPSNAEPRIVTGDVVLDTLESLLPSATEEMLEARERETVPAVNIPEPTSGFTFKEVRYPVQRASILRGPDLFIREDHTLPVIHVGFYFAGGMLFESRENAGITRLLLQTMLRGTSENDPPQFHRQLEIYGARITPVVEDDYFGFSMSVLSKNIEEGLDLLMEVVKSPRLNEEEFERQKQLHLAEIERDRRADCAEALRRVRASLFADHAYSLDALGSRESASTLELEKIRDWYEARMRNFKPLVVILGDTEGTSLARYFVRNFSGSRYQDVEIPGAFVKFPESGTRLEASIPGDDGCLVLGFPAPPEGDADAPSLTVLRTLLAGQGGRLAYRLRDELGLVQSVSVEHKSSLRGGATFVCLRSAPGSREKVLEVVREEIGRIFESQIAFRDYRSALNASVGRFSIGKQGRWFEIEGLVRSVLSGYELEGYTGWPARLQEVQEQDLTEVARRFLNPDRAVELHVSGKAQP